MTFPKNKISILGMVLLAVSAIVEAMSFKSNNTIRSAFQGSLTLASALGGFGIISSMTCEADTFQIENECTANDDDDDDGTFSETSGDGDLNDSTSISSFPAAGGIGGDNTSDGN